MNRTLQAEEAARERIAAAQTQALERVAAAREARHRIIARAQGRITRIRRSVADRLEAELQQLADQQGEENVAGAFPAADVEALQTAIRRLAVRLIGGDSGA